MKNWILLAAGLIAGSANAMEAGAPAPGISIAGEGSWELICRAIGGGEQNSIILNGNRRVYSNANMHRISYNYKNGSVAPLVISASAAGTCPFKGASAEACALTVPKGRSGSFEIKFKG